MKSEVDVGDTLGWVLSPELSRELTGLLGAREIAAAALASARSGDKPAQVELARALLTQARASYDEQRHLHERNSELHARKIISDQEYQQANDRLEVLRSGVDAAEAQLTAARSGQKDDVVREHRETVAALDAEIMALRRRLGSQTYTAPIPGKLSSGSAGDTLLCLRDTETLLVLPMDVEDCARLRRDVPVAFSVPGTGLGGSARILHVRDEVLYLQGRPVCLLIAEITPTSAALRPGLITRADVPCHALPPAEYLSRLWHGLFH